MISATVLAVPAFVAVTSTPAFAASASVLTLQVSPVSGAPVGGNVSVTGKYEGAVRGQRLTLSSSDPNVTLARTSFSLTTAGTFSTTAAIKRVKTSTTATITAASNGVTTSAPFSYVFTPVASISVALSRSFSGDTQQYYINVSGKLSAANGDGVPYRTVSITSSEGGTWRTDLGGNTPDSSSTGNYTSQMYLNSGGARTITFTVTYEGVSESGSIAIAGS
ncbi:hypothetical protein [Microbacterium sp. VKM Ac-2923]|uniref:hypothetical protein n=1 Tax=Microbacterium sp. VKM Ac-2923 TaxID=2929476 RepID=UPI001FB1B5D6|nr:hypothetical protein [Microbacterium sp. VKM Ac-2923]MCJ1709323.1 hypothetical protein [Microbacterium sp. VKM Ac-2923]